MWLSNKILDNADGKQARKTGNSSSLGLLFDHGCDALATAFGGITFLHIVGVGPWYYFLIIFLLCFTFYCATYEQYITGRLDLPIVNPVNEGLTLFMIVAVTTGIVGNHIWMMESGIMNLLWVDVAVVVFASFMSLSILLK